MVQAVDPFRVNVNGEAVEVDHRTFTLAERRASRVAVLKMTEGDDLVPDEADALRDAIVAAGFELRDGPDGPEVVPA